MLRYAKPIFGWAGAVLSVLAAFTTIFGSNYRDVEMIQAAAMGIAALACFRSSEFFADKEK
jgi:hypothetical protein